MICELSEITWFSSVILSTQPAGPNKCTLKIFEWLTEFEKLYWLHTKLMHEFFILMVSTW